MYIVGTSEQQKTCFTAKQGIPCSFAHTALSEESGVTGVLAFSGASEASSEEGACSRACQNKRNPRHFTRDTLYNELVLLQSIEHVSTPKKAFHVHLHTQVV